MLQVNLFQHKIFEKMTKAQVGWPICLERIQVQGLKQQASIKHIAGTNIIAMALNQIWPRREELNRDSHWLPVAPDIEFDGIASEFSLHHFLKFRAFAFKFDIGVAGDGMIVDGEKNIAGSKEIRRGSSRDHCAHQH